MILAVGPTTPAALAWNEGRDEVSPRLRALMEYSSDESSTASEMRDDLDYSAASLHETLEETRPTRRAKPWRNAYGAMSHDGCINTACWLECPWRLSTTGNGSILECELGREHATQLVTSGDDRVVKVWDVSMSMGSLSPVAGGYDTALPFGASDGISLTGHLSDDAHTNHLSGLVRLCGEVATGHAGNVFHVVPINDQAGKLLTCSADGQLRLCDLQVDTTRVIRGHDDNSMAPVAFSHILLTPQTGLLCSEDGLHRFDLRLSAREQDRTPIISDSWYCKSCIAWSPHSNARNDQTADSTYVFAGGSSPVVSLLDLRAASGQSVQRYQPHSIGKVSSVSISGLDVSRDGRTLLASYENDQIYSFPVFRSASALQNPSFEEIESASNSSDTIYDLNCYGGHLNYQTFLKNARFAGPNDEFICTGSDSGCAWIFESNSGSVVSLLTADSCTCNGVIPHPSLPLFASYGIDSTAKLWRATTPVLESYDDTSAGRYSRLRRKPYQVSALADSWKYVRQIIERDADPSMMPDNVPSPDQQRTPLHTRGINGTASPVIGNSYSVFDSVVQKNMFSAFRAYQKRSALLRRLEKSNSSFIRAPRLPTEQSPEIFQFSVSVSRLRFQAYSLGIQWDPNFPWQLNSDLVSKADCVPDYPSDWLLLDEMMTGKAYTSLNHRVEFSDIQSLLLPASFRRVAHAKCPFPAWLESHELPSSEEIAQNAWQVSDDSQFVQTSRQCFVATIALLKDAGNKALAEGNINLALHRYDKAIRYSSYAFLSHGESLKGRRLEHLACRQPFYDLDSDADSQQFVAQWSPILELMVTSRLNMSLVLLRPELSCMRQAFRQAEACLEYLYVYPEHHKARSLRIKAHFRMGIVELKECNLGAAIRWLQKAKNESIQGKGDVDPLIDKRLKEAERQHQVGQKRQRKQYKRSLDVLGDDG